MNEDDGDDAARILQNEQKWRAQTEAPKYREFSRASAVGWVGGSEGYRRVTKGAVFSVDRNTEVEYLMRLQKDGLVGAAGNPSV